MPATGQYALEIDVCDEDFDTLDGAVHSLTHDLPVQAIQLLPGSRDNWPVFRFTATDRDALVTLLTRYDPDDGLALADDYIFTPTDD